MLMSSFGTAQWEKAKVIVKTEAEMQDAVDISVLYKCWCWAHLRSL